MCSCTKGIIKHVQWCIPCNNAKLRTVISVPHQCLIMQYANVLEVYKECEVGNNEHNYESACACGIAFFSMCLLVCMKYVYAHVHIHYKVSQQICKYNRNLCSLITCIALQVRSQASNEWKNFTIFTKQKHQ